MATPLPAPAVTAMHGSAARYVYAWLALCVLTVASYSFSRAHLGSVDTVVALGIAVVKGLIVLLVFMHLADARLSHRLAAAVSFFLVALLISLVAVDVLTRHTYPARPLPDDRTIPAVKPGQDPTHVY